MDSIMDPYKVIAAEIIVTVINETLKTRGHVT